MQGAIQVLGFTFTFTFSEFYSLLQRDALLAMQAAVIARAILSVRPSICLSHSAVLKI